jgi:hypothetical protein
MGVFPIPDRLRRIRKLPNFSWPRGSSETRATPPFLRYLRESLQKLEVSTSLGTGFKVVDTHRTNQFTIWVGPGSKRFTGGFDAVLCPASSVDEEAVQHARASLELKKPGELLQAHLAQAQLEFLAVNAYSDHPAIGVLTNGSQATILWLSKSPGQAVMQQNFEAMDGALRAVASFLFESSPNVVVPDTFVQQAFGDHVVAVRQLITRLQAPPVPVVLGQQGVTEWLQAADTPTLLSPSQSHSWRTRTDFPSSPIGSFSGLSSAGGVS